MFAFVFGPALDIHHDDLAIGVMKHLPIDVKGWDEVITVETTAQAPGRNTTFSVPWEDFWVFELGDIPLCVQVYSLVPHPMDVYSQVRLIGMRIVWLRSNGV